MTIRMNPHGSFATPSIFVVEPQILTFTNAQAVGPAGPTLVQCQTAYASDATILASLAVNNGYQSFTIPETGIYQFSVAGAAGGIWLFSPMSTATAALAPTLDGYKRLPGALLVGTYSLTAGQVITMVVGQCGGDDDNDAANCPGGGGGTFVTLGTYAQVVARIDTLLFAAGGGAGSGYQPLDTPVDLYTVGIGQSTTSGGNSTELGGINGNGTVTLPTASNSAGGGGYLTGSGLTTTPDFSYTIPTNSAAVAFRYGAKGGSFTGLTRGYGGFGCGGPGANTASSDDDKGGGGGYSGGGYGFDANAQGGGGGSYANPSVTGISITAGGNVTSKHGYVLIQKME